MKYFTRIEIMDLLERVKNKSYILPNELCINKVKIISFNFKTFHSGRILGRRISQVRSSPVRLAS